MLIVIDMQEKYMNSYDPHLIDRVNSRIQRAVDEGEELLYVRNIGKSGSTENYDMAEKLLIVADRVYDKFWPSAFKSPEFVEALEKTGAKNLELIGIDGNCCVRRTAENAVERGYNVTINLDCVGAKNEKIFEKTLEEYRELGINLIP